MAGPGSVWAFAKDFVFYVPSTVNFSICANGEVAIGLTLATVVIVQETDTIDFTDRPSLSIGTQLSFRGGRISGTPSGRSCFCSAPN